MNNILILSPWADDWDIERAVGTPKVGTLIKGLLDRGFKIHLLLPKKDSFTNSPYSNLIIHPVYIYKLPKIKFLWLGTYLVEYLMVSFRFMIYGARLLRKYPLDIIYGISNSMGLAVYWLGRKFHKPTILKLLGVYCAIDSLRRHNPIHWLLYIAEIIACKLKFSKLIIVDDGTQGDKVADYFKVPKKRFLFYPQPIDKGFLRQASLEWLKKELGFKEDNYIILFVSRLIRAKGVDVAIRAMKLVAGREPKARFLIVGDGAKRKKYEKLAMKLGIWEWTRFIRSIKYQEMWKYYGIGDVLMSTNLVSNLCLPVIEAMASGVPVVTLDIRDTRKLVKNGETGILVQFKGRGVPLRVTPETCERIRDAVCLLLENAGLREKIASKARELILEQLPDWDEWIDMEADLINSLKKDFNHG